MFRKKGKKVYGVLMDYDLSSWTEDLTNDYAKTSQYRTGTPPFTAHELIAEAPMLHLYRHDVESLFYIMIILTTHYEIETPTKGKSGGLRMRQDLRALPYRGWFDQPSYKILASIKQTFLEAPGHLDLSRSLEGFRDWVEGIHLSFADGVASRQVYRNSVARQKLLNKGGRGTTAIQNFDDETLGGHVCYSTLTDSARNLKGELEGLIVHYKGTASTDPIQVDS